MRLLAIEKAILEEWWFWFLVFAGTVAGKFVDVVGKFLSTFGATVISTLRFFLQRDAYATVLLRGDAYKSNSSELNSLQASLAIKSVITFPFRFYKVLVKMADNLRRAVQDINLGFDDVPVDFRQRLWLMRRRKTASF